MRDDVRLEGPVLCSSGQGNCWMLTSTGKVITEKITDGTVTFSPIEGNGTAGQTENLGNGKYQAKYTTGPVPAVNVVEAGGTATVTVPKVLYNPMVTETPVPSFGADYAGTLEPLAIPEYDESSVQCTNGRCRPADVSVTLKSGQQAVFYASEPQQQIIGPELKAKYMVYGVDVTLSQSPRAVLLNDKGNTYADTKINYTILPPEYNALIVDVDILKNGIYENAMPGVKTNGTDSATIAAGSMLEIDSKYEAQAVLNRGSEAEIRSNILPLPIGQLKMVTDDAEGAPLTGAVTDGAATIRLQLTARHNREAFSGLMWQVYDPQLINEPLADSSALRGTLLNANSEPTGAVYVSFNAEGTAEAVYRAPESFVRWGTSKENADKDIAIRTVQPTLDMAYSQLTGIEMLQPIKLKRPPVVLVHGLWGSPKTWDVFEPRLNDKSQYDVTKVDYSEEGQVRSIVNHVPRLQSKIDAATGRLKKEGFAAAKTDIIAHSLGGLLTREYCQQLGEDCSNKIRRFITIDTPHFGSELADLLLAYRDTNTRHLFSDDENCLRSVDSFVGGGNINLIWPFEKSVDQHPIDPFGGSIDDLATGTLPQSFPQNLTSAGRWRDYPDLSQSLSAHTIVGIAAANADGHDLEIYGLWKFIIKRCGYSRADIFGLEADQNDRIVRVTSQQGGISDKCSTRIYDTDHFAVLKSNASSEEIKRLLDLKAGSNCFTK